MDVTTQKCKIGPGRHIMCCLMPIFMNAFKPEPNEISKFRGEKQINLWLLLLSNQLSIWS